MRPGSTRASQGLMTLEGTHYRHPPSSVVASQTRMRGRSCGGQSGGMTWWRHEVKGGNMEGRTIPHELSYSATFRTCLELGRWSSGLRAHTILTEDPSLVPASMLGDLKLSSTPVTRRPDTSDPHRQLCVCTHMCMHK